MSSVAARVTVAQFKQGYRRKTDLRSHPQLFSQAVKLDDHFSRAQFQLGRLEFGKKDYKRAGEWLAKVPKSDFHYMEASFLLAICRISTGDFDVPEFGGKGKDEIGMLGTSFNRMRRSLQKAMKMLED